MAETRVVDGLTLYTGLLEVEVHVAARDEEHAQQILARNRNEIFSDAGGAFPGDWDVAKSCAIAVDWGRKDQPYADHGVDPPVIGAFFGPVPGDAEYERPSAPSLELPFEGDGDEHA